METFCVDLEIIRNSTQAVYSDQVYYIVYQTIVTRRTIRSF